jgi:hypothetical protein
MKHEFKTEMSIAKFPIAIPPPEERKFVQLCKRQFVIVRMREAFGKNGSPKKNWRIMVGVSEREE